MIHGAGNNGNAKVGGMLHLPLAPERLCKLTENYVSSNAKIKKALGVEKCQWMQERD